MSHLWSVLTVHPQRQTHLCLLTGDEMKLWPARSCHVQPRNVKQAHSPQPLGIFPEANVVTTSPKYLRNPRVILQSVHLNCFVVSQATSKRLPCYLYLPISLPGLEHYFTGTAKITGLGVIPLGSQERPKCRAPAVTRGAALPPSREPTGSWHQLLPPQPQSTGSNALPAIKGKGSTETLDRANCITLRIFLAVDTDLLKAKYALTVTGNGWKMSSYSLITHHTLSIVWLSFLVDYQCTSHTKSTCSTSWVQQFVLVQMFFNMSAGKLDPQRPFSRPPDPQSQGLRMSYMWKFIFSFGSPMSTSLK